MGLWRGTAWLGSSAGRQQVEVRANTYSGAVEQVERIYGGEHISDLREVRESGGSSTGLDFSDIGGSALLIGLLLLLWVIIEYWSIILPVGIVLGILFIIGWFAKDD